MTIYIIHNLPAPEDDLTPEEKDWLERDRRARLKEIEEEREKEKLLREMEENDRHSGNF